MLNSYIRVLENDRVLMIVDHGNNSDNFTIYLESLIGIQGAINRGAWKTILKKARIGFDFLVAFNEQKRVLVICSATKVSKPDLEYTNDLAHVWTCSLISMYTILIPNFRR